MLDPRMYKDGQYGVDGSELAVEKAQLFESARKYAGYGTALVRTLFLF